MNGTLDLSAFEAIVADPIARRELLWLRAKEKDDDEQAASLLEVDPGIVDRLRRAGHDVDGALREGVRERRKRFGLLSDECYARHVTAIHLRRR